MKTDYRKEITENKVKEVKLKNKLIKEELKLDDNLEKIRNYILNHKELDIEQLVEIIIFRGYVTKDKLTTRQLYESTKELVLDMFLEIEENVDI